MQFLKSLLQKINSADLVKTTTDQNDDYFQQAKSWADEFYTSAILSRNRWRAIALFVLTPILILFLIWMTFLIPSQHLEPLVINHYADGETMVTSLKQHYAPENSAEVESDIARYIRFRESYSVDSYSYAYRLIHLMSSGAVYSDYQTMQNINNKKSPINAIGNTGYETVKVESILFLNKADQNSQSKSQNKVKNNNLAEVNFLVTTHDKKTNTTTSTPFTATISWQYRGISNNPGERWMDWNGFSVTHYEVSQRNI